MVGGVGGWVVLRPFFYFWFVWLVCDDAGWRVQWGLARKQCVSVFDCVVFVCEMGRSVLLDADFICGTVWGSMGTFNPIRLCWVCDGGWAVSRPFFYFWLVWLVCDDGGVVGAWVLISAKQCVSVSDCVVFVCEMVGRWDGYRVPALFFVAWCGLDGDV